jgi:hypothetical protein
VWGATGASGGILLAYALKVTALLVRLLRAEELVKEPVAV